MSQVTVVIPIYNKEKYVQQAIQSVLRQTFSQWNLLLIDDASTDGSLAIAKSYEDGEKVRCLQINSNVGLAQVLNYALIHVHTPYFLHLDADDWLESHALASLIPPLQANPKAALAYANHLVHWENEEGQIIKTEKIILEQYKDRYDFLLKLNHTLTPRLYRTECVRAIGGWLCQFEADGYVEDVQMLLRLAGKYEWIWVNAFLHNRRKYKQNVDAFLQTRPKRYQYRYHLYNQLLLEWGDQYKAVWKQVGPAIYLQGLEKNPNPQPLDVHHHCP